MWQGLDNESHALDKCGVDEAVRSTGVKKKLHWDVRLQAEPQTVDEAFPALAKQHSVALEEGHNKYVRCKGDLSKQSTLRKCANQLHALKPN